MYLIPKPKKIKCLEGKFQINFQTKIILKTKSDFLDFDYAVLLQKDIEKLLGIKLEILKTNLEKENAIYLLNEKLNREKYDLNVNEKNIIINGSSNAGLLYGIQTLRQMIKQLGSFIDCCNINDEPDFKFRGFYHDVTRGKIPTLETLKQLADKMSYYKMNELQLYVEHSYLFENQSEVWRDSEGLTAKEIVELDEYCDKLNIELVPSLSSFGHLYELLISKTYRHLSELDVEDTEFSFIDRMGHHTLDVSNSDSFEIVKEMITEYMSLFKTKRFNICCDETFDLGKGKNKELAEKEGVGKLYVDFLLKIINFVTEQGGIPMFWSDIILHHPEYLDLLPKNIYALNWDYAGKPGEKGAELIAKSGVPQYLCPGVGGWNMFINSNENAFNNIKTMCSYAVKYSGIGVLNTDWGDFGHINNLEASIAGMIYGAHFSWNYCDDSYETLSKAISVVEYDNISQDLLKIVGEISKKQIFGWGNAVFYKETKYINSEYHTNINNETMENLDVEKLLKANKELKELMIDLSKQISQVSYENRARLNTFMIMGTAIELFNKIGICIKQKYDNVNLTIDAKKLAVELEYWFNDYRNLWLSQNKPSELFRIGDVIFYFADILRTF